MSFLRRYLPALTLIAGILALYLYDLDGVGVLGPDEPRYAAIGRAMAQSHDFVTPKLWGVAWFEKPPLLYWMTAAGTAAGMDPEISGRLPVAMLSLGFLAALFWLLRYEFGAAAAGIAALALATSAGWLAYSQLCLTDIPVAVCFGLAVLLALPLLRSQPPSGNVRVRFFGIGICIGMGTLAKGLVPIALAAPMAWYLRRYWRNWWIAILSCLAVALPWYGAVYAVNGWPFIRDFFIRHHIERLYSDSLQHVQPWYYYFPILIAGTFPWTPLLGLLKGVDSYRDQRKAFLGVTVCFGLILFSISANKLPGYLLPVLPALFALIGAQLEGKAFAMLGRGWLFACAALACAIPMLASILPESLSAGKLTTAAFHNLNRTSAFYIAAPLVICLLGRRSWRFTLLVLSIIAGGIYLKGVTYPVLDRQVSSRGLWQRVRGVSAQLCDAGTGHDWIFGLNFYRGTAVPNCDSTSRGYAIRSQDRAQPTLTPLTPQTQK